MTKSTKTDQKKPELQRVNIKVSMDVYNYFKERSNETGVAYSSLMFLALEQYIHEQSAVKSLNEIMPYIDMIKQQQKD